MNKRRRYKVKRRRLARARMLRRLTSLPPVTIVKLEDEAPEWMRHRR